MSADPRARLTTLPLAEALIVVSQWIEDCEDLAALNPHRHLPRPAFRLDEAWVVVRRAAKAQEALERDADQLADGAILRIEAIADPSTLGHGNASGKSRSALR